MFEITGDDIAALNDEDLRELIALLCEADLRSRGLPVAAVTWGGDQTAADGGLDVRVALAPGTAIEGFVPRAATGFQVKKQDMPRHTILSEMKPSGALRPVMQEMADAAGAYIIVSGSGSTSDTALRNRREAMAEAVRELANPGSLVLDFYDRTRIATWVRSHPGVILWVRERLGRAIAGWRSYGAWAHAPDGVEGAYLLDETVRIRTERSDDRTGLSAVAGIDRIRGVLREPGHVARLVGLSGVGKTRLVQALFDARVGECSLDPSLAIYANLSDDPDPQPVGLASDLIASRTRAILIVDNCPPDLHQRLSEIARAQDSTVSVITVEYDIRDDQPEGTDVFALEPSSISLAEKLVALRFPQLSQVDLHTVAESSGGNARVAIALAATIGTNETVAGLTDMELFRRLFQQRHEPDDSLLRIAQACSLVYSFEGAELDGEGAELPVLARLAGKKAEDVFRAVAELRRRDLVQQRGVWRAVLPHAIANRLAKTALEDIPYSLLESILINGGSERLLRSFSRRLGYLDGSKEAVAIVKRWLSRNGLLNDITKLNELGKVLLVNVAPVAPLAVLDALERGAQSPEGGSALAPCTNLIRLLRSLAYDAKMFDRSVRLLLLFAEVEDGNGRHKEATDAFVSLFTLVLSGTHATIDQRLHVIQLLLRSENPRRQGLGVRALQAVFQVWHYSSDYSFEFGARSRDYGYQPQTQADVKHWFGSALRLAGSFACADCQAAPQVRAVLAEAFRGLWTGAGMYDDLERICGDISKRGFWREGWIAVRQTRQFDGKGMPPDIAERLAALDTTLRPGNLADSVRALVFFGKGGTLTLDDLEDEDGTDYHAAMVRMDAAVEDFGKATAADDRVFAALLPELVTSEGKLWRFGRGLALGAEEPRRVWHQLVEQFRATPPGDQNVQALCGFLGGLDGRDAALTEQLLDAAITDKALATWLPFLQIAVPMDRKGVERLKRTLALNAAPIGAYRNLSVGRSTDPITGPDFKELVLTIAAKENGYEVAIEILAMRLQAYGSDKHAPAPEVVEAGRELLSRLEFGAQYHREDHNLGIIVRACLKGADGAGVARDLSRKLMEGTADYSVRAHDHNDLIAALLHVQPFAVLDSLFSDNATACKVGLRIIENMERLSGNPLNAVPDDVLLEWCEGDAPLRYPIAAAAITPFAGTDGKAPLRWTSLALGLLKNAPDRLTVLKELVAQFRPNSWSGSLATLMESRLPLLDDPQITGDPVLKEFAEESREVLRRDIESQRRFETEHDKIHDERFE